MADRDRRILLQQQKRSRFAHDVAAPDNDRVLAADWKLVALEQLDHSRRRAGLWPWPPRRQQAYVVRMKSVHILLRRNRQQNALRIDMGRQRELYQYPVDFRPRIQILDDSQKFLGGDGSGWRNRFAVHAEFGRCLRFTPDIDFRRRIVADQNHSETGRASRTGNDFFNSRPALGLYLVAN